jgi:hypothetical protein
VRVEVSGIHRGDRLHFAFSRSAPTGDTIAAYIGLLRDERLDEPGRFVVARAGVPFGHLGGLPGAGLPIVEAAFADGHS